MTLTNNSGMIKHYEKEERKPPKNKLIFLKIHMKPKNVTVNYLNYHKK